MLVTEKANYRSSYPYVTSLFIAAFWMIHLFGFSQELPFFPKSPLEHTILTNLFAHASISHLLWNCVYLYLFGDNVEDALGHLMYGLSFLFFGLIGTLFYFFSHMDGEVGVLGASGAISGILGVYLVFFPNVKTELHFSHYYRYYRLDGPSARVMISLWFALQVALYLLFELHGGSGIAFSAHIGGFMAGLLFGFFLRRIGFVERHRLKLLASSGMKKGVLCPGCNTPRSVASYGRYVCSACQTEFYFDEHGTKIMI